MADRMLDGHLAERLVELRGQGLSHEAVARQLHTEAGVLVTGQTVRNWVRQLEAESAA